MLRTRVTFTGLVSGPSVATMYFGGDDSSTTATAVRSALNTFWTALAGQMHTSITASLEPEMQIVDAASGEVTGQRSVSTFSVTGSNAGNSLSPALHFLVRWRSGFFSDGRELRGRTYIPGPTSNGVLNGAPTSAARSAIDTAADALIADGSTALLVYRRPRPADVKYDVDTGQARNITARDGESVDVTSASTWTKWAVLRSRRD